MVFLYLQFNVSLSEVDVLEAAREKNSKSKRLRGISKNRNNGTCVITGKLWLWGIDRSSKIDIITW